MVVGVKVAEIVGLLAELNLGVASSELFDQETVQDNEGEPLSLLHPPCTFLPVFGQ